MFTYWFLYILPAILAFAGSRVRSSLSPIWVGTGLMFVLAIGFREQVGGDWTNYLRLYHTTVVLPLDMVLDSDPGYGLLSLIMSEWNWDIYGVNTVCGAIFILGLSIYCRQLPVPWLGFAVAVPYLVTVVAMGYTRQSVALGLFFLALADIERGHSLRYVVWVALGATFHKSGVLLVPLGIFLYRSGWLWRSMALTMLAYGLWDLLLAGHEKHLWKIYVDRQMESEGARIRVLMNLIPGLLLLWHRKRWKGVFPAYEIWLWLSIAAVASALLVDFATTAVDRVSLYFTPLQVAIFARLPELKRNLFEPQLVRSSIIVGYATVLFVWLNYATHALYWLPYRNILLE